jgi:hypothetical protein
LFAQRGIFAIDMKYFEYRNPIKTACFGDGSINWALNFMSDLAQDIRPAAVRFYDLNHSVADHSNRQMKLLTALTEGAYRNLFPLFHSDPLVCGLPENAASQMFKDIVAATAHLLPSALVKETA